MSHSIFENSPKVEAQRNSIGENSKFLTLVAPHPSPIPGVGPSLSFNSLDYTRHHSKDTRSMKISTAHFISFGEKLQTLKYIHLICIL